MITQTSKMNAYERKQYLSTLSDGDLLTVLTLDEIKEGLAPSLTDRATRNGDIDDRWAAQQVRKNLGLCWCALSGVQLVDDGDAWNPGDPAVSPDVGFFCKLHDDEHGAWIAIEYEGEYMDECCCDCEEDGLIRDPWR